MLENYKATRNVLKSKVKPQVQEKYVVDVTQMTVQQRRKYEHMLRVKAYPEKRRLEIVEVRKKLVIYNRWLSSIFYRPVHHLVTACFIFSVCSLMYYLISHYYAKCIFLTHPYWIRYHIKFFGVDYYFRKVYRFFKFLIMFMAVSYYGYKTLKIYFKMEWWAEMELWTYFIMLYILVLSCKYFYFFWDYKHAHYIPELRVRVDFGYKWYFMIDDYPWPSLTYNSPRCYFGNLKIKKAKALLLHDLSAVTFTQEHLNRIAGGYSRALDGINKTRVLRFFLLRFKTVLRCSDKYYYSPKKISYKPIVVNTTDELNTVPEPTELF